MEEEWVGQPPSGTVEGRRGKKKREEGGGERKRRDRSSKSR
jgi:hypothetical protein